MSTQAVILTICNVLVFIAVATSMFLIKKEGDANTNVSSRIGTIMKNIAALIMFAIVMALQVYSLNCMIYGDCHMWTWIITGFAVFGTLSYLGIFVYLVSTLKRVKDTVKSDIDDIRSFGDAPTSDAAAAPATASTTETKTPA